jgi:hypothetical protein
MANSLKKSENYIHPRRPVPPNFTAIDCGRNPAQRTGSGAKIELEMVPQMKKMAQGK